ncbi:unnamed protein product, partial [Iphiclides podalirius]
MNTKSVRNRIISVLSDIQVTRPAPSLLAFEGIAAQTDLYHGALGKICVARNTPEAFTRKMFNKWRGLVESAPAAGRPR